MRNLIKRAVPAEPRPGERFGRYELLSLLGEGGMGSVYLAQADGGEQVALKVIKPALAGDDVFRRRFAREARSAAKVSHPHVVALVDVGEEDGVPYLAQRYVAGGTLDDRIGADGPLPLEETVMVCLQVAGGLGALHEAGLVHRDLKPSNILIANDGSAHLTDFGLAKDQQASVLTKAGQAVGSVDYMAPEQIRGQPVTPRTDVYALGCVVAECLSGCAPFADRQGMRVLWAHLQDDPPDPCANRADGSPDLSWAVLRALEKDPAARPPTATAFARMVQIAAGVGHISPGRDA
jgi:serine/threonine-protein kinase